MKYNILKPLSDALELKISNWESIESDKDYNHYDFEYESVTLNDINSMLSSYVKVETALMSYSFPTEEREISNYIYDALFEREPQIIEQFELQPFLMCVQSLERTIIDKLFAVCDYYMLEKPTRNARHLYDIYKIAPYVSIDGGFLDLVREVRNHRRNMGERIAPSAVDGVDMMVLVQKIVDEDFYKDDYFDTTTKLISDSVSYQTVKEFYYEFAKKVLSSLDH